MKAKQNSITHLFFSDFFLHHHSVAYFSCCLAACPWLADLHHIAASLSLALRRFFSKSRRSIQASIYCLLFLAPIFLWLSLFPFFRIVIFVKIIYWNIYHCYDYYFLSYFLGLKKKQLFNVIIKNINDTFLRNFHIHHFFFRFPVKFFFHSFVVKNAPLPLCFLPNVPNVDDRSSNWLALTYDYLINPAPPPASTAHLHLFFDACWFIYPRAK